MFSKLLTSISEYQQAIIIVIQEVIRIIFSSGFQVVLNWFLRKIAFIVPKEKRLSFCDKRKQIPLTALKTLKNRNMFHSFIKYHFQNRV